MLKGKTVVDAQCLQGPRQLSQNVTIKNGKGKMDKHMAKSRNIIAC